MIALASMTDVARFSRNDDQPVSYGEPGVELAAADMTDDPVIFGVPATPVGGLRAVVARLVHGNMPSVPTGAPPVIAQRDDTDPSRPADMPYRPASVYHAVQGVEQTSGWWSGAELY